MSWDPRNDGALCDLCALSRLRVGAPVPSEFHAEAIGTVVAEAPGKFEVLRGRPLVGPSGMEYEAALTSLGRPRATFHVVNALSCSPPDSDLARVMARLKSLNDKRVENDQEKLPSPLHCCRPRLEHDLRKAERVAPGTSGNIVVMGKIALEAITGRRSPILDIRGAPILHTVEGQIGHGRRVLPTPHPAFVLRARRWTKVYRSDIGRAVRWFIDGKLGWIPPRVLRQPTPLQLRRWLLEIPSKWTMSDDAWSLIVDDVETTVEGGPMWNKLRCVGYGKLDADERGVGCLFVPFLSVDGVTRFYSPETESEIRQVLREFYSSNHIEHFGHNRGYFDRIVMGEFLAEDRTRRADGARLHPFKNFQNNNDTILIHRAVESELPHKLGFVGSAYSDVPGAWKEAHTAINAQTDEELALYNVIDIGVNARIIPPLAEALNMRDQAEVVRKDYKLQEIAIGMHRNGIPVHEPTRMKWEVKLRSEAGERDNLGYVADGTLLKKLIDIAGDDKLNPRSPPQLRKLLFNRWGLAPALDPEGQKPILTMSGYPSTSNAAILELRRRGDASPKIIEFIDTLRRYRKKSKLLATYVLRLRPPAGLLADPIESFLPAPDDDEYDIDDATGRMRATDDGRIVYMDPSGGVLDDTREDVKEGSVTKAGRVHGSVNVHTPKTGRFSITKPPMQTFPLELRDMFRAPPGQKFIIADKDQIELRHTCGRANAPRYLQVFAEKKDYIENADHTWTIKGDPHSLAAGMAFGERFTKLKPKSPDWTKVRDFTKKLVYACAYKAEPATVHRLLTSVENADGYLVYANMSLLEVTELRQNWLGQNPEIEKWWQVEIDEFRKLGYRRDAIWGRRCDFLDGENENEIVNYDEQAGCSAIIHDDTFQVLDQIPFEKWGPYTGMIHQEHDKIIIQCPEADAEWVKGIVSEALNRFVPQIPNVRFTSDAKICDTLQG